MTKGTITSHDISDFKGGWFIGDFNPSLLKTKDFEAFDEEGDTDRAEVEQGFN